MRGAIFQGSRERELWFQSLQQNGLYAALKPREFLPAVTVFCGESDLDCTKGTFKPFDHPFRGRVSILVDYYCYSVCDGFVWQMTDKLQGRVRLIGQPSAGDPAISRLAIDVDAQGNRLDGIPFSVDQFVPTRLESFEEWHNEVLEAALRGPLHK